MSVKTLEQIVANLPIYGAFSFEFFDKPLKETSSCLSKIAKQQLRELFHKKKIDLKCVECEKEYPFDVSHSIQKENSANSIYYYEDVIGRSFSCAIDNSNLLTLNAIAPEKDEGIINYVFKCTMNPKHYQTMSLLYTLKDNVIEIRKIGQKPISIDLKETYSSEYEKILKKYDAFEDYRHYEQSASRNLLAGACTYLRRVLEKMIQVKLSKTGKSGEEQKALKHIEDKIEVVKDQFDDDVKDILTQSYGLLSQGIHELDNDQIEEFYKSMLEVINIQLEAEKEKLEREAKRSKLRSEINEAVSKNRK